MSYRRIHMAILALFVAGGLVAAAWADSAPYHAVLGGTGFTQVAFGLGFVDFRPGVPAWVAREAAVDFTRTFDLVSRELETRYPPGPYRLLLYRTIAGYANGLTAVEHGTPYCETFTLETGLTEPMGDQVLGIPLASGGQGALAFTIGHELTDALVAYTGGSPFAVPCRGNLLTPWVNDGFADYVGSQIGGQEYAFTPVLKRMGNESAVAFQRSSGTSLSVAVGTWPQWRRGYADLPVGNMEYDVADEMVRSVIRRGGMALFRRVVRAAGASQPLTPVLGESPLQLANQAWAGFQRWFASHRMPAAYFEPRIWLMSQGAVIWAGRVYAFGLQPGATPHVAVNGRPFRGSVPPVGRGGLFFLSIPPGARQVTVDGMPAQLVTADLAQQLMAGGG